MAFSPDDRWIASGAWDKTVHLAFGPDGRWLVTGAEGDERLRIWDVATARVRKEIQGPGPSIRQLAVSPNGRRVAAHAGRSGIHLPHPHRVISRLEQVLTT